MANRVQSFLGFCVVLLLVIILNQISKAQVSGGRITTGNEAAKLVQQNSNSKNLVVLKPRQSMKDQHILR